MAVYSNHNPTTAGTSVEAVAAQLHTATGHLHTAGVEATRQHLDEAAGILASTAADTENQDLIEAHQSTKSAVHVAAAALVGLAMGRDNITHYANHIVGSGQEATAPVPYAVETGAATTRPEHKYVKAPMVVEERQVGNMRYTFALSTHSVENAPDIALSVKNCDIVLVESAGAANAEAREQTTYVLSQMTNEHTDPEIIDKIVEQSPDNFPYAIANQLRGKNKLVIPIDINKDNPNWRAVEDFQQKISKTSLAGYMVAPVVVMRQRVRDMTKAASEASAIRDRLMAEQILTLHHGLAERNPHARIGVILGAAHYNVLKIAGFDTPERSENTKARIIAKTRPDVQAYIQQGEGIEPDAVLIDRVALNRYVDLTVGATDRSTEFVQQLSDNEVAALLRQIDEKFTVSDLEQRRSETRQFLQEEIEKFNPKSRPLSIYMDEV